MTRAQLNALHQADEHAVRRQLADPLAQILAKRLRRHSEHDELGTGKCCTRVGRALQARRQRDAGQVVGVGVTVVDRRGKLGAARPNRHVTAGVDQHGTERRAP